MGEIAEMMLDGTLCENCGDFIGEGSGFPRYCSAACAKDRGAATDGAQVARPSHNATKAQRINTEREIAAGGIKKFNCDSCSKRFRYATALAQHERDKHGPVSSHERKTVKPQGD